MIYNKVNIPTIHFIISRLHLVKHEFRQFPGESGGQGAWCAMVHGVARAGHDLTTEQQQKPG